MKTRLDKEILDTMSNNPGNWRGLFYVNRKDSRIFVPKIYPSMGWTLNLANPYAWMAGVGIVILIVAVVLLTS